MSISVSSLRIVVQFLSVLFTLAVLAACGEGDIPQSIVDAEHPEALTFQETVDANGYQEQWYENSAAQYDSVYKKFDSSGRLRVTGMYDDGKKIGKWYSTLIYFEGLGYEPYTAGTFEETWYENDSIKSRYLHRALQGDSTWTMSETFFNYGEDGVYKEDIVYESKGVVGVIRRFLNEEFFDTSFFYQDGLLYQTKIFHQDYTEICFFEGDSEVLISKKFAVNPYGDIAREEWFEAGKMIRYKNYLKAVYLEDEMSVRIVDENGVRSVIDSVPWESTPWIKD